MQMKTFGLVALGGFMGGLLREGLMMLVTVDQPFPWATLLINLTGTFLTVLLGEWGLRHWLPQWYRPELWVVGVLGAYTTYATLILDVLSPRPIRWTLLYVGLSVGGSVLMVWAAQTLARRWSR